MAPVPTPPTSLPPEGIFTRGDIAPAGSPISASAANIRWSDCQATKDGPFDWTTLDNKINLSTSRGFPVRLRPMLGASAPAWAIDIGAGPMMFFEIVNNKTDPVPVPWDPEYQSYAETFVRALAAHVKDDERVMLVFASAAMTKYAEPLVRGVSENCAEMTRCGYTPEKDKAVCTWQLDIMSDFTQPIAMSYNPFGTCSNGHMDQESAFPAEVMDHQIALYGPNTVLQNNELGRTPYRTVEQEVYDAMTARNTTAIINFQCAAAPRLAQGEYAAIKDGHDTYGATGVEWAGTLTDAEYAELDAYLKT